jgi:hypothetical protein
LILSILALGDKLVYFLVRNKLKKIPPPLFIIGHVTEAKMGNYLITRAEEAIELKARGWNALLNKEGE